MLPCHCRNLCRAGRTVRCLQLAVENLKTCPERAKRVEWIEIVVVPVVQRIEQGLPKAKTAFLLQFPDVVRSEQMPASKRVE
jgi:hypothetical protein